MIVAFKVRSRLLDGCVKHVFVGHDHFVEITLGEKIVGQGIPGLIFQYQFDILPEFKTLLILENKDILCALSQQHTASKCVGDGNFLRR